MKLQHTVQGFVNFVMVYHPKEIPEEVNVTSVHLLVNFAYLLGTVVIFSALVYLGLGAIADQLVTRMSPEMEAKIGQQLLSTVPDIATESYSPQQQHLQDLANSLATLNSNHSLPLTIHIQKNNYPNAAILPGGHILVTTSLLEEAESENELAFVLAHELGHHVVRDPLKALGRSLVLVTVASALGFGNANTDIISLTGSLSGLHYSRQQETAADIYALSTVINFYGHGGASLDFFERIQAKNEEHLGKLSVYFSTHPLTEERIELLYQFATEKDWQMTGEVTDYQQ